MYEYDETLLGIAEEASPPGPLEQAMQNTALGGAVAGAAGLAGIAARTKQRQAFDAERGVNQPFAQSFGQVARDSVTDLNNALLTITNRTPYDQKRKRLLDNPQGPVDSVPNLRSWSRRQEVGSPFYANSSPSGAYVANPLTQMAISARDAFAPSSEDFLGFRREQRLQQGESPEGPKSDTVFNRIPLLDGYRDLAPQVLGGFSEAERAARASAGIDLMQGNSLQKAGGFVGRAGADFVNNGARSLWWLLNAPQAVVDVASEGIAGLANRDGLYGVDYALDDAALARGWVTGDPDIGYTPTSTAVNTVRYDADRPSKNDPQIERQVRKLREAKQKGTKLYSRRRVGNNLSTLMALPAAVLINNGLGLNSLDGQDGRKAVFADPDDPTQTSNAIAEVAAKYILGRQGDYLPYDEFRKVRPDVTPEEFRQYKGYRFNKNEDWNVLDDGRLNIANGVLKYNNDGIDGAEVMFLGRSLPVATTIAPVAASIVGAGLGASLAKYGALNIDGVRESIGRRQVESKELADQIETLKAQPIDRSTDIARRQKQKDAADKTIAKRQKRLQFMEEGPASALFKAKALRNRGVVGAGLAGGVIAGAAAQLVGNEMERRRRDREAELGI